MTKLDSSHSHMVQYVQIHQCDTPHKQKKRYTCMIISKNTEKTFNKIQYPLMIKNSYQSRCIGNISQHNKSYLWQTHSQCNTQGWKTKSSLLKSGTRQGCSLSPILFNTVLEVLTIVISKEKEIKDIQIGREEVKLSLYVNDMIVYTESHKDSNTKLLELINSARCQKHN